LGAAIGDALGFPVEFVRSFDAIRAKFGRHGVRGYVQYWERNGARFAPYTDDTQMAELVLKTFTKAKHDHFSKDQAMKQLAQEFLSWAHDPQGGHRAPGNACLRGCLNVEAGTPWYEAGGLDDGGCGSVMRAFPAALLFPDDEQRAITWAVAQSKITHRAPIALAACAAMAGGMLEALRGSDASSLSKRMVKEAGAFDTNTAEMIEMAVKRAETGESPHTVLNELEGWAAHECIAAAAFVITRHPASFENAVLEAANTPGDSDSIATLVGALLGAWLGRDQIPENWIRDLERSTELEARAHEAFVATHLHHLFP
jgi:ADP-ribosylglycohydrolase